MNRYFLAASATAASALALAACQNGGTSADNTLTANTMVVNSLTTPDNGMASGAMAGGPAMNGTAASIDQPFLTDAIKGDNGMIALGQLAQQKGGTDAVKNFGQTLETDHAAGKQQASDLAQQAGMAVPTGMTDMATQAKQKLAGLSGAAFDKAFIPMMIDDHTKDIAKFENQAQSSDIQTAQLAQQTLPTLRKHLQIAQGLAK